MWKPDHRRAADRRGLRYPSDLTDAEWALVSPLIAPAKRDGRPRTVDVREVLNAIFYVLSTGCQWSALPSDLPPRSTVWADLDLWDWDCTIQRIHDALYVQSREAVGREASPTTAIIDAQSAKGALKGGVRLIRPAMRRARRSSGASVTSSSICSVFCLTWMSTPPTFRIAMAGRLCCVRPAGASPSSSASLGTVAMGGRGWPIPSRGPGRGLWRSSNARTSTASWFSPNAGSSNAPSVGSAETVA